LALAGIGLIGGLTSRLLRGLTLTMLGGVLLAFWLSLGPVPHAGGEPLGWPGIYLWLHDHVPGYSGLRVPARFISLFFVFVAVLAGLGVAVVERFHRFAGRGVAVVALGTFILHSAQGEFPLNRVLPSAGLTTPPPDYLTPAPELPPIYRAVESLRPGAVLVELPFGDSWYDVRYMFFAGTHRRRLLNGYSGLFPPSFLARQQVLQRPLLDPEGSAQAIGGATHVIVHQRAWADDTGVKVGAWLQQFGATPLFEADGAVLYELPVRENFAAHQPYPPYQPYQPYQP
jgi:hypothetical protein